MKKNVEPELPLVETAPLDSSKVVHRQARVLIAEDDWALRDLLTFAFEDEGCEVVAVRDGASLLGILGSSLLPKSSVKPFDLVISDIRMPGWSGLDALERLSRSSQVPPIVVITAFGSEAIHARAKEAGVVAVLDKPFDIPDLTALGRRVIAESRCPLGA
jgi:CheY-like chemotaxis protein